MNIVKVINNNIVTSEDQQKQELIVMGRGLGFGKKPGQQIPDDKIEKIFSLSSPSQNNKLIDIIKDIPFDHINCAIERHKNNLLFQNPLLWETKQYYPSEFQVGVQSLHILKNALGITFPVDEAGLLPFTLLLQNMIQK